MGAAVAKDLVEGFQSLVHGLVERRFLSRDHIHHQVLLRGQLRVRVLAGGSQEGGVQLR